MLGVYYFLGTAKGLNIQQTNQHSLVFIKLTVQGRVFIYFPRSIKLKNLSKILYDAILLNPFLHIHEKYSQTSEHTHFVIVPQNQWNFIDFTGSVVLKYNF